MEQYYNKNIDEIRIKLNGNTEPINDDIVKKHIEKYGYNELAAAKIKAELEFS